MKLAVFFIVGLSLLAVTSAGAVQELFDAIDGLVDELRDEFEALELQYQQNVTDAINNLIFVETVLATSLANAANSGQIGLL